jgi:molybdopterin guanine dinucleotide-containing S/N-oxide reductase-like protein
MAGDRAVDVKNGRIVRIRPIHFDEHANWEALNPWKIEARGKVFECPTKTIPPPAALAYKKRVYSPNRIKYPLKRVDWEPGGDPAKINPQNRGKSKFVRISWDEAATIIADEIKRVTADYGARAILAQQHGHGEKKNVACRHGTGAVALAKYGGDYTNLARNPDSWEGWNWGARHVWGQDDHGKMADHRNVWVDALRNSEMILFWGCDPETTPWGWGLDIASKLCYWLTEVGIKSIYVCPDLNYGAAVHADKWIPVLPNTDMALHLALAYVWITEGTYDKDFVEDPKYCVGFDKYRDYVLGEEDGVPKTPEWASPRCGVPTWTIKALARVWAKKATSQAISNGGSHIRGPYSTEPARMMVYNLAMQGLGKPGVHQLSFIESGVGGLPSWGSGTGPVAPSQLRLGSGAIAGFFAAMTPQILPSTLYHEGILNPPVTWHGPVPMGGPRTDQFIKVQYPLEEGGAEVHMIWMSAPCQTVCWQGGNKLIKAWRDPKIECIVGEHPWFENDMLYCDVIIPALTMFEVDDIQMGTGTGMFDTVILEKRCIEPVGESKSDYDCAGEIAKKLGVYDEYTEGLTYEQRIRKCVDESVPEGFITWEELQAKQVIVLPANPDWEARGVGGLTDFRADPEKNKLDTETGKFEFECQGLKEHFPDDKERPPVAHWVTGGPASEGWTHDESLWGERAKEYTLLLITNHPRWRVHAQYDDITWLREIPTCKVKGPDGYLYEPIWINPVDAAERGIQSGDIVKMYNDRGAVLGGAIVWDRVIAGAVYQDHGARIDEIIPGELDRGGSPNLIAPVWGLSKNAIAGEATSGFLVEVEKVSGDQMEEWRKQYPEAFKRPYDPAAGLCFNGWVEEEASKT